MVAGLRLPGREVIPSWARAAAESTHTLVPRLTTSVLSTGEGGTENSTSPEKEPEGSWRREKLTLAWPARSPPVSR